MSRPNITDDPQAPLLAGGDEPPSSSSRDYKISVFNRSINIVQLLGMLLALVAIGVSIAAIGKYCQYINRRVPLADLV